MTLRLDQAKSSRQSTIHMMLAELLLFAVFFLALLVLAPSMVIAQTNATSQNTATAPDQAQQTPAGKFVQDLGNKAISVVADKNLTQDQRSKKYHSLLQEAFDMQTIGHFVLGRAWSTATTEQQQEYMKLFEAIVVKIYGDRLSLYSGEKFQVKTVRSENDKDSVVSSEVDHPGGTAPTSIDWRVRQGNGKLSVVDVVVEGVSQSVTQRQEYATILQRNNGDINALLDQMRQNLQHPDSAQVGASINNP